jgi:hypothetical protein
MGGQGWVAQSRLTHFRHRTLVSIIYWAGARPDHPINGHVGGDHQFENCIIRQIEAHLGTIGGNDERLVP